MQRVAALYLPMWPLDRLRRAERPHTQPETVPVSLEAMRAAAAAEQVNACSVPRGGGWRPGARWARQDSAQPWPLARHEAGRREEVVPHPFRAMRPDEGGAPVRGPMPSGPTAEHGPAPRVTCIRAVNRVEIAASCPRARALGIVPGMALTQARVQVPGLDIRPADPEGDMEALTSLALALARRWAPTVAVADANTLFLDLTGVAHLHGGEARMATRLVRLLARMGFQAHVAVADTAGAAWALAHHARGRVTLCPRGAHADMLESLPVTALRVGTRAVELLRRLGVERIGQLAALPRGPLVRRLGKDTLLRLDQALGYAAEPLEPVIPAEAIIVRQRFAEPIASAQAIEHWLGTLTPRLAAALEAEGLGVQALECIAERVDGVPQRIRIGLARPNRDAAHLLRLLKRRIEDIEPGYGIDAIALHVRRAGRLGSQELVERLDEEAVPDIATLVDTLATRIGQRAMWRAAPVESDVPERSVTRMAVLDPPERTGARRKREDVRQLDRSPALHPWHPGWPKPARLLARPERIDHVMAELPDHAPRRFTWRGRAHRVVHADGPERILGEWWRRDAERASVRDYFRVEDEEGHRYWVFRRGDGERPETGDQGWYLHGVFG